MKERFSNAVIYASGLPDTVKLYLLFYCAATAFAVVFGFTIGWSAWWVTLAKILFILFR